MENVERDPVVEAFVDLVQSGRRSEHPRWQEIVLALFAAVGVKTPSVRGEMCACRLYLNMKSPLINPDSHIEVVDDPEATIWLNRAWRRADTCSPIDGIRRVRELIDEKNRRPKPASASAAP